MSAEKPVTALQDDLTPGQVVAVLEASVADLRAGRTHDAAAVGAEARKLIDEAERRQDWAEAAAPGR